MAETSAPVIPMDRVAAGRAGVWYYERDKAKVLQIEAAALLQAKQAKDQSEATARARSEVWPKDGFIVSEVSNQMRLAAARDAFKTALSGLNADHVKAIDTLSQQRRQVRDRLRLHMTRKTTSSALR